MEQGGERVGYTSSCARGSGRPAAYRLLSRAGLQAQRQPGVLRPRQPDAEADRGGEEERDRPLSGRDSSLQRAFAEVSRAVPQNEILSVTGIGPGDDWSVELRAFSENAKFVRTDDYRNGVDVTVNHDGSYEVEAYKG